MCRFVVPEGGGDFSAQVSRAEAKTKFAKGSPFWVQAILRIPPTFPSVNFDHFPTGLSRQLNKVYLYGILFQDLKYHSAHSLNDNNAWFERYDVVEHVNVTLYA